jgi:hypothetical protein
LTNDQPAGRFLSISIANKQSGEGPTALLFSRSSKTSVYTPRQCICPRRRQGVPSPFR